MKATKRLKAAMRHCRCWLRGHDRVAVISGPEAIVLCRRCLAGDEVPILRTGKGPKMPTRSAADLLHDIHSGRQPSETIAVNTAELLSLAVVLLRLAVPPDEDPRRLLDVLVLAGLDPDRQGPT